MSLTATRWTRVAFTVFTLAALGFALNLGLGFGDRAVSRPEVPSPETVSVKPVPESSLPPLSRYAALETSRVFAPDGPGAASAPVVELNLPKVKGYRLIGLMTGSREHALAVVEETAGGRQKMAGIGQKLGPGVLVAVFGDRIVLEVGGQRRQLIMSDRTAEALAGVITLRREKGTEPERVIKPAGSAEAKGNRPPATVSAPLGSAVRMNRKTGTGFPGARADRASDPETSSFPGTTGPKGFD